MKIKILSIFCGIIALLCLPRLAFSQASLNLDVSENRDVYFGLETLIGFGLIPNAVQAQKPWSANEVQSYLMTTKKNLPLVCENQNLADCENSKSDLLGVIENLEKKIARFLPRPNKNWSVLPGELQAHIYYLDSPFVTAPVQNGIGRIDAQINPLTNYFSGRHFVDGTQYSWELNHGLQISPYLLGYAHYRFENLFPTSGSDDTNFLMHKAYAKIQYKNLAFQVGRDSLTWGQSANGGLLLSDHARPLDMILLSSDTPFVMPWLFKYLGPTNLSLFAAQLGETSYFPNGFLTGYKLTFKPDKNFEFGLGNMVMMGGEGAPTSGLGRTVGDYIGFSGTSASTSNRILGFDGALTVPFLNQSRLYAEVFLDDKSIFSVTKTILDTAAYTAGIFVPRLNSTGTLQWRVEGTYISQLFYRHWQFRSGMTLNNLLLGDPLGPDGYRALSRLYWQPSENDHLEFSTTIEGRDSNIYKNTHVRFSMIQDLPTDKRLRQVVQASHSWNKTVTTDLYLGYEHAFDFAYQDGNEQNNYFLGMTTRFALWR